MEMLKINEIEITSFNNEDIANYITKIYASKEMKELSQNGKTFDQVQFHSSMLADFLVQYAMATGDMSDESMSKIAGNYLIDMDEYTKLLRSRCDMETGKSAKQLLFEQTVMPSIIISWADKLQIEKPISLANLSKIASAVALQSRNNSFHTHSFNSAILPAVEEHGLDISKEFFKNELKQFSPIGHQPYKTGVLNTCELSAASFSYASVVPERVKNIMAGNCGRKQQENETLSEHLSQCVSLNLESNSSLTNEEKKELQAKGNKIIDFYYGHQSASIAVMKQNNEPYTDTVHCDHSILYAASRFMMLPQTRKISPRPPMDFTKQIQTITRNSKDPDALNKLDTLINETREKSPETENYIQSLKEYMFGDCLCRTSLPNLLHSLGDGYDIEGGKIPRTEFSIATYDDPAKMFSLEKSKQKGSDQQSQQ